MFRAPGSPPPMLAMLKSCFRRSLSARSPAALKESPAENHTSIRPFLVDEPLQQNGRHHDAQGQNGLAPLKIVADAHSQKALRMKLKTLLVPCECRTSCECEHLRADLTVHTRDARWR